MDEGVTAVAVAVILATLAILAVFWAVTFVAAPVEVATAVFVIVEAAVMTEAAPIMLLGAAEETAADMAKGVCSDRSSAH